MLMPWLRKRRSTTARRAPFRWSQLGQVVSGRGAPLDLLQDADRPDATFESGWRLTVKKRAFLILGFIGLWAVTLEARLVQLQVFQHVARMAAAQRQQESVITLDAMRGDILDRTGQVLASSVEADSIAADPKLIDDPQQATEALCTAFGDCTARERDDLLRKLSGTKRFEWVRHARDLSAEQVRRVQALKLSGILIQSDPRRYYPRFDLAAHVLGFVGQDNAGQAGVEYSYDKLIRGQDGLAYAQVDARRKPVDVRVQRAPMPGATLELTLDMNLQYIAERELQAGVQANKAKGGTAIIMDPFTGEILALANCPTFNPNSAGRSTDDDRRNRALADVYEPGSTFKIVTASAAIENKIVSPTDLIDTNPGFIVIPGRSRPISDTHHNGVITFEDVIVKSSNVGAVKVGLRTGAALMTRYVQRFGFGQTLAPDLTGESRGIWSSSNLSESGLASVSMGYQVSVTPLQMATAASAVANGGLLMQPHVVRAIVRNGVRETIAPRVLHRAIEPDTAAALTSMMEGVVQRGTATAAQIGGYPAAGKTGTAHKIVAGHYSTTDYNASFVAFVPSRRPVFTILVVIDTPRAGQYYGGTVSAPVFKRIAEAALQTRGIPATVNPEPPILVHDHDQVAQLPTRRTSAPALLPSVARTGGPAVMPDVRGLSAREALRVLDGVGLLARMSGSGFVIRQSPAPGEVVEPGSWAGVDLQRTASLIVDTGATP
jgi:cell division protein FtsI (penicillin-binding protein 3)